MNTTHRFFNWGQIGMFWIKLTCKGICHRYKAIKPPHRTSRYVKGQKRCNSCDIYIEWNGFFCPCCGYRLRAAPRSKKYKEKVLDFSRI